MMKKIVTLLVLCLAIHSMANSQIINVKDRAKNKATDRTNNRIDQGIDRGLDAVEDGVKGIFKKKNKESEPENNNTNTGTESASPENKSKTQSNSLEEVEEDNSSNLEFKRGETILFNDNFEKDAAGDFPARWNATLGGEVKKLKGFANKFLKIPAGSVVNVELTKPLPENFTVETEIILPADIPIRMAAIGFGIKPKTIDYMLAPDYNEGIHFAFHSDDKGHSNGLKFGRQKVNTEAGFGKISYNPPLNKAIKVAFMVNGKRIRMYVDGDKKVDMPSGFDANFRKAFFFCASTHGAPDSKFNYFYISNIVIAETGKDERSSVLKDLLDKGSFTTNAILFASNSDKLQAESDAIISQIAEALKQADDMKIKIIGHTDSDGDINKNQQLSEKRSAAVKNALVAKGIKADRMITFGKGETEPIASNSNEQGKALNRRVEIIRINN